MTPASSTRCSAADRRSASRRISSRPATRRCTRRASRAVRDGPWRRSPCGGGAIFPEVAHALRGRPRGWDDEQRAAGVVDQRAGQIAGQGGLDAAAAGAAHDELGVVLLGDPLDRLPQRSVGLHDEWARANARSLSDAGALAGAPLTRLPRALVGL